MNKGHQVSNTATPTASVTRDARMSLLSVTAMGIGAMVGAGIFALLGEAALQAGSETWLSFLISGFVAALSGYSYARLAIRYPELGGVSAYFDHAFGVGRVSGTLSLIYVITMAASIALVAKAFGAYAAPLALGHPDRLWANIFASGIVVILAVPNIMGSGLVGKAEVVLVGIKLAILATLMVAGTIGLAGRPPVQHFHAGALGVGGCAGLTFLAYAGYSVIADAVGNVADPKRTIPRAISLAIAAVIVLYVGLAVIVLASISPVELARHSETAVAEAAQPVLGQAGYVIVSIGALLATASGVNAWLFSVIKMSLALAKAGQLPRTFRRMVWRDGTQGVMIGIGGILLVINVFDLSDLASIASATFLVTYLAVHVAHWRLIGETKASRWLVGLGLVTMAAVLGCFLWTSFSARPWSLAAIGLFLAGSWVIESLLLRQSSDLTTPV
jgi:amino acid transporter